MDLGVSQPPTVLSLLTPEYQKRSGAVDVSRSRHQFPAVERILLLSGRLHAVVGAALGSREFPANPDAIPGPETVSGTADNFLRQMYIGKNEHVQKVPQWWGETIGFWDGTTLVTWTAKCSGLDVDAFDVRIQRQNGNGRNLEARIRCGRQIHRAQPTRLFSTIQMRS